MKVAREQSFKGRPFLFSRIVSHRDPRNTKGYTVSVLRSNAVSLCARVSCVARIRNRQPQRHAQAPHNHDTRQPGTAEQRAHTRSPPTPQSSEVTEQWPVRVCAV